jgi:ASPM-SPD-2-Hydin domain-containing protein
MESPRALGRRFVVLVGLFLAFSAVAAAFAPTITARAASDVHVVAGSTNAWTEDPGPGAGTDAVHLMGQVKNETGGPVSDVQVPLTIVVIGGPALEATVDATVLVMADGEVSPFDYIVFLPTGTFQSFTTGTVTWADSYWQASHPGVAIDACTDPDPDVCQNLISGTVTNPSTGPQLERVRVILTFLDSSGKVVSQDVASVRTDAGPNEGTDNMRPNDTASFSLDRSGELPWDTLVSPQLAEGFYPLDINPADPDFGNQRVGVKSGPLAVSLTNNGETAIAIASVTPASNGAAGTDFTESHSCASIAAHDSCTVNLYFQPTEMGPIAGTLTIANDAAGTAESIPLAGVGVASLVTLDPNPPNPLSFPSTPVGSQSSPKDITVTNSGTADLNIYSVTPPASDFTLVNHCPDVVPADAGPDSSCTISVTFAPTNGGTRNGMVTITDDALTGNGTQQVPVTGHATGPGVAFEDVTPNFGQFGNQNVGVRSDPRYVNVKNVGDAELIIYSLTAMTATPSGAHDFAKTTGCGPYPAHLAPNATCTVGMTYTPGAPGPSTGSLVVSDNAGSGSHSAPVTGTGVVPPVVISKSSSAQYHLSGNNGVDWQEMDAALRLTVQPQADSQAILSANVDLWTGTAGINQDVAIFVSTNGAADQLVAWKESGGRAGTFSPNAAFVQGVKSVSAGSTYLVKLKWKSNVAEPSGATIHAGAGPYPAGSATFSPTRLTAQLVGLASSSVITQQRQLTGSDGVTWQEMDTGLRVTVTPSATTSSVLGLNADLWTASAGLNQDLAIFVKAGGGTDTLLAWKESGGNAGTFSPNAAFVQATRTLTGGTTYLFKVKWKTNTSAAGRTIFAGAGPYPSAGVYSPTRLTVVMEPGVISAVITQQRQLTGSNGSSWTEIDPSLRVTVSPSANGTVIVGGNADLWTAVRGYNQDIAIFVSDNGQADQLVAWKESGGFSGTFSPNAAFVHGIKPVVNTHSYVFKLKWKTNVAQAPGATIVAGAGSQAPFSPTRLTTEFIPA